jgi:hypothetical protein
LGRPAAVHIAAVVPAIHCKSSPQSYSTKLQLRAFHFYPAAFELINFIQQLMMQSKKYFLLSSLHIIPIYEGSLSIIAISQIHQRWVNAN